MMDVFQAFTDTLDSGNQLVYLDELKMLLYF